MSITKEAKQEVERLLRAEKKLHAIKYLADTFSIALDDAKTLVEAVETEMQHQEHFAQVAGPTVLPDLKNEVSVLIRENRKTEAIKLVHERLDVGLKKAKDIVDDIEHDVMPGRSATGSSNQGCGKGMKIFSLIFGFIGFGLLGVCALIYYFQQQTISNSEMVEGTVVNLRRSSDGDTFAPDIKYTWANVDHVYESSSYTNPSAFDLDEKVNLYVNKDDPADVVVDSITERWLAIMIIGGIGGLFVFFSGISFFAGRKF